MKVYKDELQPEQEIPAKTIPPTWRRVYVSTNCDLCKEPIVTESYDATEVEVRLKEGSSYPEGGMGTYQSFDVCAGCFKNKIIPFFAEYGAKPVKTEWEW